MTAAEQLLWRALRNKQLGGLRFRRQHPLGQYFLDFYCHSCRLAVELDGPFHEEPYSQDYDNQRDLDLASHGICVIRFGNQEVLDNMEAVLREIQGEAERFKLSDRSSARKKR